MSWRPAAQSRSALKRLRTRRVDRTKRYSLHSILVITICAVICGADSWVAVELFGRQKKTWLKTLLKLPFGIPSHDTLGRVFALLDPRSFRRCFTEWVASISALVKGETVAIDGKTVRRSFDPASEKSPIHMVNAWAQGAGISLGQIATDAKSNEITAIPKLLELLELKGCIVTTDAMGCQKTIAEKVVAEQADYVLALKGNQGTLHDDVVRYFDWAHQGGPDAPELRYQETTDGDHGRVEIRRYWLSDDVSWLKEPREWVGLSSLVMTETERHVGNKISVETRYFISSLPAQQYQQLCGAIRGHWSVENNLHWVLDVAFREDECRVRTGHAAENFAIIRQIALNLLKQDKSVKVGIANKRMLAALNEGYLAKVLGI